MQPGDKHIKCVVVGDAGAGKLALLVAYTAPFPLEYVPTVFDITALKVTADGEPCVLSLWNTSGQEQYDYLRRRLSYPQTNVFIICFSVASPASFDNIKTRWVPEIKKHCPKTPFILVGTKIDLRGDSGTIENLAKNHQQPITTEQGEQLARELKAAKYVECSALTRDGIKNVFDQAILTALGHEREVEASKNKCVII